MPGWTCHYCKKPIKPTAHGNYRLVEGWVKIRSSGGGTNAVYESVDLGKYIHGECWKARKYDGAEQTSLL